MKCFGIVAGMDICRIMYGESWHHHFRNNCAHPLALYGSIVLHTCQLLALTLQACSHITHMYFQNSEPSMEMIVAATTQTVQGFSLKGKVIFKMDTNLVEPIQHL